MIIFCLPSFDIKSNRVIKKIVIGKTEYLQVEEVRTDDKRMTIPDIIIEKETAQKVEKPLCKKKR